MEPRKIDPNNTLEHPVVALRAEGPMGFTRSLLQFVGGAVLTCAALLGRFSIWWIIVSIPVALFALVEVIGSLRYAYLVRHGRSEPSRSRLE